MEEKEPGSKMSFQLEAVYIKLKIQVSQSLWRRLGNISHENLMPPSIYACSIFLNSNPGDTERFMDCLLPFELVVLFKPPYAAIRHLLLTRDVTAIHNELFWK